MGGGGGGKTEGSGHGIPTLTHTHTKEVGIDPAFFPLVPECIVVK